MVLTAEQKAKICVNILKIAKEKPFVTWTIGTGAVNQFTFVYGEYEYSARANSVCVRKVQDKTLAVFIEGEKLIADVFEKLSWLYDEQENEKLIKVVEDLTK